MTRVFGEVFDYLKSSGLESQHFRYFMGTGIGTPITVLLNERLT
jgi:hypothetical protein